MHRGQLVGYEVSLSDIRRRQPPREAPQWIKGTSNGLEVEGDRVEYRETFVWHDHRRALIATQLEPLMARLSTDSQRPAVSPFGVSQVLNHGFTPVPHTALAGVQRLAGGDTLLLTIDAVGGDRACRRVAGSKSDRILPRVFSHSPGVNPNERMPVSTSIVNYVIAQGEGVWTSDAMHDSRSTGFSSDYRTG